MVFRTGIRERSPVTWELRAFVGRNADGKPHQVTRTVKGGKRTACMALVELEADAGTGKHGTAKTAAITVEAVSNATSRISSGSAAAPRQSTPIGLREDDDQPRDR